MSERDLQVLTSRGFLAGLALLLLNDFLLKPLFHNALTGKLSDFAGLFVFPLFWSALLPRFRKQIYLATAALFAVWKSAYSQPLVEAWNSLHLIPLGRTVDATDLVALLVLPASYLYGLRAPRVVPPRRLAAGLLACVSVFAFAATSYRTKFDYGNKYFFEDSQPVLLRKAHHLKDLDPKYRVECEKGADKVELRIPAEFCFDDVRATVAFGQEQGRSVITLREMEHECPEGKGDKQKLLNIFEKDFIGRLGSLNLPAAAGAGEAPTPKGEGTLYMVAIGELPGVGVERLAEHFRRKYGLPVKVLRKLPLADEARDPRFPEGRPAAERLLNYMRREHAKAADDNRAVIIAVTADMYAEHSSEPNPFAHQTLRQAVISLNGLDPATFCEPPDDGLRDARLRKAVARQIGALYYRLPPSADPRSVLHTDVGCIHELDAAGEDF